jgi:penicillin amidase
MIPENYGYAVGFQWASPERFLRISEVLSAAAKRQHKLSLADMENLQNDVVSLPARDLRVLLKHAVGDAPSTSAKLLLDWDCAVTADSTAATLYEFWDAELRDAVTKLAVPPEAQKIAGKLALPEILQELSHPRATVFGQNPDGARDALLLQTLQAAEQKLAAKLGPDPKNWSWGNLHRVSFKHPLGHVTPAADALFDRGPFPRPGDGSTVDATYFGGASFDQLAGASYREIFDLSDWDNAVGVNVPGQSGQPGSPHYDDLLPLWIQGQYFPLRFSKPSVDRDTTDVLELKP